MREFDDEPEVGCALCGRRMSAAFWPEPVWEYRTVSTIETVNARAAEGWRLHTAVPFATHIQYVLERRRP